MASIKDTLIFGKDPDNEAQVIGVTGVENDQLKTSNTLIYNKMYRLLKEIKKTNLYLSTMTDNIIRKQDI